MNALGRDGRTLILKGLDSPFRNVRLWACRKVALNHITVGVPGLIRLLNSSDSEVAVQAVVALEEISRIAVLSTVPSKSGRINSVAEEDEIKQSGPYSSKIVKNSVPRSVFPLPGEGDPRFGSGIEYYVKDLAPLKFVALSIGAFLIIYFLKGVFPLLDSRMVIEQAPQVATVQTSSVVFEDLGSGIVSTSKPPAVEIGTIEVRRIDSQGVTLNQSPGRDDVWLALARRYLEAGRPHECIKYCKRLIEKKRKVGEAQELKRLARERYGVIN